MYKLSEILKIVNGKVLYDFEEKMVKKISTDTRKDVKDSLFIPIIGENFDGHNFIKKAYEKGAISSLTERKINEKFENLILVEDTLYSYGEIAKDFVKRLNIKTIGITGTSGKTTVKEILSFLTDFPSPDKSFNNLIGVPETILKKGKMDSYLILEFGTNRKGEISRLTEIANPVYAILTNIGFAHLQGFKDIYDYAEEKLSIIFNSKNLKKAVVNWDNEFIRKGFTDFNEEKIVKVSRKNIMDYRVESSFTYFKVLINGETFNVKTKLYGIHNAFNFVLALYLIKELGLNIKEAVEKFETFKPINLRFEISESKKGYTLIKDCYNANLESFRASLESFKAFPKKRKKIAVIGDILELGKYSTEIHEKLGELINSTDIDIVVGVGHEIKNTIKVINSGRDKFLFDSKEDALNFLKKQISKGDYILFKASRKMELEKIAEELD